MEIKTNIPFQRMARKGTITEKIYALEPGQCLTGIKTEKAPSVRAMAKRYGIKLRSARQENGETWFWRG